MDLVDHQRLLTALATRLVGPSDADDVVQETFLRALVHPPVDTEAPIAPWLVTVARNLALDRLRQRSRFVDVEVAAIEEEAADPGPVPAERALPSLLAGLGSLSPGEVTVLLLRDGLDLDVEEVAAALDTTKGSVRVLHHRARRKAAAPAPLDAGLSALDRFLSWLLHREVAGLPVVGKRQDDPGLAQGVLAAHQTLLDAMIAVAITAGDTRVEGRARLFRGIVLYVHGRTDAVPDLTRAIELGADPTLAEAYLAQLLYRQGDAEGALRTALSALARGDHTGQHGLLHRLVARVHEARGDAESAAPHLAALRALEETQDQAAYAAFARASIAMTADRFEEARTELLVALDGARAAGNLRNACVVLNNLCFATLSAGDLREAAVLGAEGLGLARSLGDRKREASILGNLATVDMLDGRLEPASLGYARAISLCAELQMKHEAEDLRGHLATLWHQNGDVVRAEAELTAIISRLDGLPGLSLWPRVHQLAARAELGRADPGAFDALQNEIRSPSLHRALQLYQALAAGPEAIEAALASPAGSAPAERVARAILGRVRESGSLSKKVRARR